MDEGVDCTGASTETPEHALAQQAGQPPSTGSDQSTYTAPVIARSGGFLFSRLNHETTDHTQ